VGTAADRLCDQTVVITGWTHALVLYPAGRRPVGYEWLHRWVLVLLGDVAGLASRYVAGAFANGRFVGRSRSAEVFRDFRRSGSV